MPLQDLLTRAGLLLEREVARGLGVSLLEPATEEEAVHAGHVPLISCAARVEAGGVAHAQIHVANEDTRTIEAALYFSNFIGDSGYDIPAIAGHVSPRVAEIAPGAEVTFEIELSVPRQTPAGTYSGLVQVTNSKYVKAVLILEVV